MPKLSFHRVYETIAFITGFALMAFELVASRLLAPTIGSSTYVWTSVIGVIIAALSLGYAAGGWLADKRVAVQDIGWLLLASAGSVLFTLINASGVISLTSELVSDARLQGLVTSLVLFLPTSFILGAISPYLVRLRIDSVATTGRSVAALSALNSLGGITGTFLAGFVFFGYIGSRETLGIIIGLLVVASWLVVPRYRLRLRIGTAAALAIGALLAVTPLVSANTVAVIDTASSHYTVENTIYKGQRVRVLTMGPSGFQSGVFLDGSKGLVFDYTQRLADLVAKAPQKDRILILGGGAFTLPDHLAQAYPSSHIDVVEIDPKLVDIASQYFFYRNPHNVQVITQDARAYLTQSKATYDIIIVDAYSDISLPFALSTQEYARTLRTRLNPDGTVFVNMLGATTPDCKPLVGALHRSYMHAFTQYRAFPLREPSLSERQNIIVAYSNQPLAWAHRSDWAHASLPRGMALTDNFAPTDRLHQQCWH